MLLLKKIDVYGQVFIMTVGVLIALGYWNKQSLLIYFVIGGWQLTSMMLHVFLAQKLPVAAHRKQYKIAMAVIGLVVAISFINQIVSIVGFSILLVISPFLSVWFYRMGYKELRNW